MIAQDARNLTIRLYQGAITRRDQHFQRTVGQAISHATSNGATGNGRFHMALAEMFAAEYQERADLLWDTLQRVLSAQGVTPSVQLGDDLKAFLSETLLLQKDDLNRGLWNLCDRFRINGSAQRDRISSQVQVSKNELDAKVELFTLELQGQSRKRVQAGGVVQNFYGGTIGVVQTGHNSTAQVSQSISTGDSEATVRALDALGDALKAHTALAGLTHAELLESVSEMRQEVRRPQPSHSKLMKLAGGLALAIQTSADMKPAYELFRTVLLGWGIQLPLWP